MRAEIELIRVSTKVFSLGGMSRKPASMVLFNVV